MRVLVTWGSKAGGTEEIARTVADELSQRGCDVVALPARRVKDVAAYDAVIVGGALYVNRWHADARRFVDRNVSRLREIPVWLFSSGPLDDSADRSDIPPVTQAAVRMERIGACGHATFGGRLRADAKGFMAASMAKEHAGDWRNTERIRAWASEIARALPGAPPRAAVDPPARSLPRLLAYGAAGGALCAAVMAGLQQVTSTTAAIVVHAVAAPLIFTLISVRYFRGRGAREPIPTALTFAVLVAALDAGVVAALGLRSFSMFSSIGGTWLPFALIFLATWATGATMSTLPWSNATTSGANARADGKARGSDERQRDEQRRDERRDERPNERRDEQREEEQRLAVAHR